MHSNDRRVHVGRVLLTLAAASVISANSVPLVNCSVTHPTGLVEERFHWIVTRDGELANSVRDVEDPDELSRYSEFDVTVRQRRKRTLSDDDVIGPVVNASAAHRGKRVRAGFYSGNHMCG